MGMGQMGGAFQAGMATIQQASTHRQQQAAYVAEQRRLRAQGQKGDPDFKELTLGGIGEADAKDYADWCSRADEEDDEQWCRHHWTSIVQDRKLQVQVFHLTQRFLAFEEAADPKSIARDAQSAKQAAEKAAKESQAASQRATTAAADAATAAAKQAQAAVDNLMKSAVSDAEAGANTIQDASARATASAASAAGAAAKEAAAAVQKQMQPALRAAEDAAKAGEAACKRAQASAESSEMTPLMEEIRGLRAARKELDGELAKVRAVEERLAQVESHCCIQSCSVM